MERLKQRLALARRALEKLEELAFLAHQTELQRDACIQRFKRTFEATWKAAQRHLAVVEGSEVGSPAGTIRLFRDVGSFDDREAEAALAMLRDRNLTVHTYNEDLAREIAGRIPAHARLLALWLERMSATA